MAPQVFDSDRNKRPLYSQIEGIRDMWQGIANNWQGAADVMRGKEVPLMTTSTSRER